MYRKHSDEIHPPRQFQQLSLLVGVVTWGSFTLVVYIPRAGRMDADWVLARAKSVLRHILWHRVGHSRVFDFDGLSG